MIFLVLAFWKTLSCFLSYLSVQYFVGQDQIIPQPSFFQGLQFQGFKSFFIWEASRTLHPPSYFLLYSFCVVYVFFQAWAICLDGIFEMWSHQTTVQGYKNLICQTWRRSFTKFAVSIRTLSNASVSWDEMQGDTGIAFSRCGMIKLLNKGRKCWQGGQGPR